MKFIVISFLILLGSSLSVPAQANDFGLVGGNRAFSLKVSSFKAQRFNSIIPQQYDFSCGSAALATLLKYHYDLPVTEQEVLDAMYVDGDQEKIKEQGFSLLDMKRYLETHGYRADGFQISLNKLKQAGVPGIVLINTNNYMHFVVVKGMDHTHVLLGDPALGLRKVTHEQFKEMWNNIFFVIRNQTDEARLSFSHDDDWSERRQALFRTVLTNQALSTLSVQTTISPHIYY